MTVMEEIEIKKNIGNLFYWAMFTEKERNEIANMKVVVDKPKILTNAEWCEEHDEPVNKGGRL